MLILLLSAVATPPVAVDVAGMEPQIEIIRRDAAERGWQITCEGKMGEERVLRLTFPPNASVETIRTYLDPEHHIGSSQRLYHQGDTPPELCDHEPPQSSASGPSRVLGFGPRETLTQLANIARACGFMGAAVRKREDDDVPAGVVVQLQDEWLTLDAGEDTAPRYGPSICFIQMQSRALAHSSDR